MKFLEHWWKLSQEGRVLGQSPRKIWLTQRVMQKIVTATFFLSFITILINWYLFAFGYFPNFKTKQEIIHLIRAIADHQGFLVLMLLGNHIFNYILYGKSPIRKVPDVLIFKPASVSELLRVIIVLAHELFMVMSCYLLPIILFCLLTHLTRL